MMVDKEGLLAQIGEDNERFGIQSDPDLAYLIEAKDGDLLHKNKKEVKYCDMKRIEILARSSNRPSSATRSPQQLLEPLKRRPQTSSREQRAFVERISKPKPVRKGDPKKYLSGPGVWCVPGGGKFNESNPKSWIDWKIYLNKCVPGPATYADTYLKPDLPRGGRFNEARPLSQLDLTILKAKETPGPGGSGQLSSTFSTSGVGKINMKRGKTELDWEIYRAKQLPGPGQYTELVSLKDSVSGGRFGKHNPKSELDQIIYRTKDAPGPAQYYPEHSYKSPSSGR